MTAPSRGKSLASEWIMPIAAVGLIFVMLVPMPSVLLDLLLAVSMTVSVLVLLSAIQILRPSQFSVFPSLLLLLTLFRLSLNLASSRRILLHGNEGASAAGQVIEAFGQFVVGGNYVVGFVLFIALIAIQYLVVAHGAVRTAEVTARFTLDAMPGKQMAIDADLNAGLINEAQARARRERIAHDAEFYGAMDGAARFNQRDAIATILITAINIVAGFLIGVFQLDIPFREALKTYTVLTVGDGLVTMIPSLLVSMAGGIVVTRASSEATLSVDVGRQILSRRRPLIIAAGVMLGLAAIPGLPKFSFFLLAAGTGFLAWRAPKTGEEPASSQAAVASAEPSSSGAAGGDKKPAKDSVEDLLKLDELSLEVGYGLVPLVDQNQGGQLLARVRALRQNLAQQLGFIVPPIHITDNVRLKSKEYAIALRGVEVARWEMQGDQMLAISSEGAPRPLPGTATKEPAFGAAAVWIAANLQNQALSSGYAVVDQTSVLATHLAEVVKQHAHELLTRQETKRLLDRLAESHPKLVEELVPKILSLGEVQKTLQQLLREQVSVRDLSTILETLLDVAPANKNPVLLVECARQALARALVRPLLSEGGGLRVVTLDRALEDELGRAFGAALPAGGGGLQPPFARRILDGLRRIAGEQLALASPVLLCSTPARYHLKRLLEPFLPKLVVLSPLEVPPMVEVQSLGVVR
jgi:flagellar biosynthesis protein FlhA